MTLPPSPFPGMNPYLEDPQFWSAVHNRLIVAIADELVDHLSEKYRVEIEKRTYFSPDFSTDFSTDDESVFVGIPDVLVATGRPIEVEPVASIKSSLRSTIEPLQVTVPLSQEVNERYLEIREVATGKVVTVIEILSPKNKRSGEGRDAYQQKRQQVLNSTTHLVEIDLLRGGNPFPISTPVPSTYRILVCRGDQRPNCDLYAFSLRQPIPAIPMPLLPGEPEPVLALQPLLDRIYERGRYHLAINYQQLPQSCSQADQPWIEQRLQDCGLRS